MKGEYFVAVKDGEIYKDTDNLTKEALSDNYDEYASYVRKVIDRAKELLDIEKENNQ